MVLWVLPALALPTITHTVTDEADVLSTAVEHELDGQIRSLRAKTGVQLAVVTLERIERGETIDTTSLSLAEAWGGGGERDDGLLVVLAVFDRRSRIEVGYGLEGYITDAEAGALLDAQVPHLQRKDDGRAVAGIVAGLASEVDSLRPDDDIPGWHRAYGSFLRAWAPR
jgi:uncharacterized protein